MILHLFRFDIISMPNVEPLSAYNLITSIMGENSHNKNNNNNYYNK